MPNIGYRKIKTEYLSIADAVRMGLAGLTAVAVTAEVLTYLGYKVLTGFLGTSTAALIGATIAEELESIGRFKFVITQEYVTYKIFDTHEWVDFTGWDVVDMKVSIVS